MFDDIMIDIESLSTATNASIIEIAAVAFDRCTGETGEALDVKIHPSEWGKHGRDINGETIMWWMRQSRKLMKRYEDIPTCNTLHHALLLLSDFISRHNEGREEENSVVVWGNGATMDITIIQSAYEHFGMQRPWPYWAVNDVRTIVRLCPSVKKETHFKGQRHSPVDDCRHEIRYLVNTLNKITNGNKD